jgi:hypothetical protein
MVQEEWLLLTPITRVVQCLFSLLINGLLPKWKDCTKFLTEIKSIEKQSGRRGVEFRTTEIGSTKKIMIDKKTAARW